MNFERRFVAARSTVRLVPLARDFLEQAGYRRVSDKPMVYRRGSRLGSWTSFTPSKWLARATVDMRLLAADRTEVTFNLSVNDHGQLVADDERRYWETEVDAFERAMATGEADNALLDKAERLGVRDRSLWVGFIVWSATGIVVSGVVTYFAKAILGW